LEQDVGLSIAVNVRNVSTCGIEWPTMFKDRFRRGKSIAVGEGQPELIIYTLKQKVRATILVEVGVKRADVFNRRQFLGRDDGRPASGNNSKQGRL
jgi:hypothetical protein